MGWFYLNQRCLAHAVCVRVPFPARVPGRVHDARAERWKHNKKKMGEGRFGARRLVYDETLQEMV